jgi:hypothetical protein
MANASFSALRIVLVLVGLSILVTGVNVAFGGIRTLGWQGERMFFDVTNETAFWAQDSHVRFLGGMWLGVGLYFIVASTNLVRHRRPLSVILALVFLGGLARLTQMHPATTFGPSILGSFLAVEGGGPQERRRVGAAMQSARPRGRRPQRTTAILRRMTCSVSPWPCASISTT